MRKLALEAIFVVFCLYPGRATKETFDCDMSTPQVEDGNIGQTKTFSWLGVLRVHLRDADKIEVAISGLVLVTPTHGIVNADDVAKIPEKVFKEDTVAMFVIATDVPQFYPLLSYTLHPEYEKKTLNTIAIVELKRAPEDLGSPRPICWPMEKSLPTKYIYLTGYTDDNNFLEKMLYRMQHKDKYSCEDFYIRAELDDKMYTPVHYVCGVSPSTVTQCLWENGMALVTNESSYFALQGLSIRGPGCNLPGRFIDLYYYRHWVEQKTSKPSSSEEGEEEPDNLPTHTFFRSRSHLDEIPKIKHAWYQLYPFDIDQMRYFNVDKVDNHTIAVFEFNQTFEAYEQACSKKKVLVYQEELELRSEFSAHGIAYYKISLYDVARNVCGCVIVNVESFWHSDVTLAYKEFLELGEGIAGISAEETPRQILKEFRIIDRTPPPNENQWSPNYVLKPRYLADDRRRIRRLNYDLYVRFGFYNQAKLHVEMYAEPKKLSVIPGEDGTERRFSGLTPNEKRMQFQNQRRMKMTRPPSRRKWYEKDSAESGRQVRSGLVEKVDPIVEQSFVNVKNHAEDDTPNIRKQETAENEESTFLKEAMASIRSPEPINDFQRFFEPASDYRENKLAPKYSKLKHTNYIPKSQPNVSKLNSEITSSSQGMLRPVLDISSTILVIVSIFVVQNINFTNLL